MEAKHLQNFLNNPRKSLHKSEGNKKILNKLLFLVNLGLGSSSNYTAWIIYYVTP